jgi:hypothetical protein
MRYSEISIQASACTYLPGGLYTFHHQAPHFTRRRTMSEEEAEAFREKIRKALEPVLPYGTPFAFVCDTTPLEEINSDGNGRISWV